MNNMSTCIHSLSQLYGQYYLHMHINRVEHIVAAAVNTRTSERT